MMDEAIAQPENDALEWDAKHWASRVIDNLKEREEDISEKTALEVLSVLDANSSITDHMDSEELDYFLDEFGDAIADVDKKEKVMDEHVKEASTTTAKKETDTDEGDAGE